MAEVELRMTRLGTTHCQRCSHAIRDHRTATATLVIWPCSLKGCGCEDFAFRGALEAVLVRG